MDNVFFLYMPKPNQHCIVELPHRSACYVRITAANRFFDNVEKALKGDAECRQNLLAEDLQDMRDVMQDLWHQMQDKLEPTK